jgi:predicted transcriptional regulator
MTRYTAAEETYIRQHWGQRIKDIAHALNRTEQSVREFAKQKKLGKTCNQCGRRCRYLFYLRTERAYHDRSYLVMGCARCARAQGINPMLTYRLKWRQKEMVK